MQDTWQKGRRWIRWNLIDARRSRGHAVHWIIIRCMCSNWSVITAVMTRRGSHLGRPIVIQGAIFYALYNGHLRGIIQTVHPDRRAVTFSKRSTMDRFIVTVDRFDRMVTPKIYIKRGVLPMFKPFELEINLIDLSRHLPSRFS